MSDRTQLGSKVRRLRRAHGVTQVEMAKRLGISPSYLNLIEHNQRPLTRPLLMRLADGYDIDLQAFSDDGDARIVTDLDEVLRDPLFESYGLSRKELGEAVGAAPQLGQAMLSLYQSYRSLRADLDAVSERLSDDAVISASTHELRTVLTSIRSFSEILQDYHNLDTDQRKRFLEILVKETQRLDLAVDKMVDFAKGEDLSGLGGLASPLDDVMDFIQQRGNHLPELEDAAEALWSEAALAGQPLDFALARHLKQSHGVDVEFLPDHALQGGYARFDPAAGTLSLSQALPHSSRAFQIARRIGHLSCEASFAALTESATLSAPDSEDMIREALASYFAGAVLLPYGPFAKAARSLRYDIQRLQQVFEASFEQVCHRLCTLQRPGDRGVPLHFVRVDAAGNVSKRFGGSGLRIARYGGVCPRWNLHAAFAAPERTLVQVAEMPGGSRYLCVARSLVKPGGGYGQPSSRYAIGFGCDISYAGQLVYADGLDLEAPQAAVPVGINCRLCERTDCRQRAQPSLLPPGESQDDAQPSSR